MWQATKDLIQTKQHKKDVQKYYEDFKILNNVVQELNKSDHDSLFVDITCREKEEKPDTLSLDEYSKYIKEGGEIMLTVQLVMNADPDKHGSLIESYNIDFLA